MICDAPRLGKYAVLAVLGIILLGAGAGVAIHDLRGVCQFEGLGKEQESGIRSRT